MGNNPEYLSVPLTNQQYPFIHLSEESNYESRLCRDQEHNTRAIANTGQTQNLDL